jgi:hypothetical protein
MTTKRMMELLLQGKKMRQKEWDPYTYIKLDEIGNLVDSDNEYVRISFHINAIWEEYVECSDFFTAMNYIIIDGGKAKRKNCDIPLKMNKDGIIVPDIDSDRYILDKDDILAKDWILL